MKRIAASGARKTTCFLRFIPRLPEADAGFAIIRGVGQLRLLRKNYPELWGLMLKWDNDSIRTYHADGHTVHDFDRRFQMEDDGLIAPDDKIFRWSMLDEELNYRWF